MYIHVENLVSHLCIGLTCLYVYVDVFLLEKANFEVGLTDVPLVLEVLKKLLASQSTDASTQALQRGLTVPPVPYILFFLKLIIAPSHVMRFCCSSQSQLPSLQSIDSDSCH